MEKEIVKAKVISYTRINETTGCWEWQAHRLPTGYGITSVDGKLWRVPRLAYLLWVGELTEGLFVCHKCDNPCCCNPEHLWLGTAKDNAQDAKRKGRLNTAFLGSDRHTARHRKLTEEDVKLIRESDKTVKNTDLAKRIGVSYTTVWKVRMGVQKIHSTVPVQPFTKRPYIRVKPTQPKDEN